MPVEAGFLFQMLCPIPFSSMTVGVCGEPDPAQELNVGQLVSQEAVPIVPYGMRPGKTVFRGAGRDLCQPPHLVGWEKHQGLTAWRRRAACEWP